MRYSPTETGGRLRSIWRDRKAVLLLLLLTATSVLVHGYHLGHQDGAIYLPAIKKHLEPALYPHDSIFFLAQTHRMLSTDLVAFTARLSRWPLDLVVFIWHLLSIFLMLLACLELARRCFAQPATQWAAVATVWAARLMPVVGTQLDLTHRYLHPRDLATAAVLLGFVAVLDGRLMALVWLAIAAVLHPTMALFGAFHLAFQAWKLPARLSAALLLVPLWGVFSGPVSNPAWREVIASRPYLFPLRWPWYQWLGVLVPLVFLVWSTRIARRRNWRLVEHVSRRAVAAATVGVAVAIVISTVPAFEPMVPVEAMRTMHFVYVLSLLLGGGLLGEYVLRDRPGRWALFLAPLCLTFFFANTLGYSASPHIEWPGRLPRNAWVEAFDWVRVNTPRDALFALEPRHMLLDGEDSHGFRAFAERSMLADWVKDRSVAALEPELAYEWRQETRDRERWPEFGPDDFKRLRNKHRVGWVILERSSRAVRTLPMQAGEPGGSGLTCLHANDAVAVCRIE